MVPVEEPDNIGKAFIRMKICYLKTRWFIPEMLKDIKLLLVQKDILFFTFCAIFNLFLQKRKDILFFTFCVISNIFYWTVIFHIDCFTQEFYPV